MTTLDERKPFLQPGCHSEGGEFDWRKGGGSARMIEIGKRETLYRQDSCGCMYSPRDTNLQCKSNGREPIRIGVMYRRERAGGRRGRPSAV